MTMFNRNIIRNYVVYFMLLLLNSDMHLKGGWLRQTPAENEGQSYELCFPNHDTMNAFLISRLGGIYITQFVVSVVLTLTPPGYEAEWIHSHCQKMNPVHAARSTLSCADIRNSSLLYAIARY
jgi:hypothetical protein